MRVLLREDPIRGLPSVTQFEPGLTIAEIFAATPARDELRPYMRARIGEHIIDRSIWHRVRPKECDLAVIFEIPLHGGGHTGGASKLLSSIASIALLGASLFTLGGGIGLLGINVGSGFLSSFFAAGQLGAKLGAAAISIGGAFLLQGLNHQDIKRQKPQQQIGFASGNNDFDPGGSLQRVVGTCKVFPKLVVPPFTDIVKDDDGNYTDDQRVTAVYALDGHHTWGTIKLGDVDIADCFDVEVETRDGVDGDDALTFVTNTPIEDSVQIQLSEWKFITDDADGPAGDGVQQVGIQGTPSQASPIFHRVETKRSPDEFRIEFLFPSGLYRNAFSARAAVDLRIRFRLATDTDWINLPDILVIAKSQTKAIRQQLTISWVDSIPGDAGNAFDLSTAVSQQGWARLNPTQTGSDAFTTDTGTDLHFVNWHYDSTNLTLYLHIADYPQGRYQFEVKRSYPLEVSQMGGTSSLPYTTMSWAHGSATDFFAAQLYSGVYFLPYNPGAFQDDVVITSIQSAYDEAPIDQSQDPIALLAIRAKNRSLDKVSAEASGMVPTWDGSDWTGASVSTNPADHYRYVLNSDRSAFPIPDSLINDPELSDWWHFCDDAPHNVGFVAEGKGVIETLQAIALCGFASPRFGAINGVVVDHPRGDGPVGMITQRNASGFAFQKPFPQRPHGLRVNFIDGDDEYIPREITVYDDGYNADGSSGLIQATRFEAVTYDGILHEDEAIARATLDMRWAHYRSRLLTFTMDVEHLEFQKGDLVWLETDIIGTWGGRGRIAEVVASGGHFQTIGLDEDAILPGSAPYGVQIRLADGTILSEEVTVGAFPHVLAFVTPPADTVGIDVGQLVVMGPLSTEARQVLIWDIAPGKDGTADITCVDYAGDTIYA